MEEDSSIYCISAWNDQVGLLLSICVKCSRFCSVDMHLCGALFIILGV